MIQLLIAILLGLASPCNTDHEHGSACDTMYSSSDTDGENGQIPPPPPPPPPTIGG